MNNIKFFIIIFLIVIVIGAGVYFFVSKNKDGLTNKAGRGLNRSNLSYDQTTYSQIASSIYSSVESMWDTNEEVIYSNLRKLRNVDDWKALITAYGIDNDKRMNLVERLINELDSDEIVEVNKILAKFNESI